jgi:(S)-ureidoglycine aminohydrolase
MTLNLLFGTTRTAIRSRHALIAPDGHVVSNLPGVTGGTTVVLISPAMGAGFTELTITFNQSGRAEFPDSQIEAFVYVLEGSVTSQAKGERRIPFCACRHTLVVN